MLLESNWAFPQVECCAMLNSGPSLGWKLNVESPGWANGRPPMLKVEGCAHSMHNLRNWKVEGWIIQHQTYKVGVWLNAWVVFLAMSNLELAAKSNVEPLSTQNPNIEPPESPILNQELQDWTSQIEFFFVQGWTSQIEFFNVQHFKNANSHIEFCSIMGFKVQSRRTIWPKITRPSYPSFYKCP